MSKDVVKINPYRLVFRLEYLGTLYEVTSDSEYNARRVLMNYLNYLGVLSNVMDFKIIHDSL